MRRRNDDVPELERLALAVEKVADSISNCTLITDPKAHTEIVKDLARQLTQSEREMRAIARRFRRMSKLAENSSGSYIVLDSDGNLRPATPDEVIRATMHYLPAGVSVWRALNYGVIDEDKDIVSFPDEKQ